MPSRRHTPPTSSGSPLGDDGLPEEWNPDSTPFVEGYDLPPDTVPAMVGVGVPAVVAVVTTRNPGPWLETMLASVAAQEYANLTTLVVDADSLVDPTQRVADVLPNAFVKRIEHPSFAEAANAALGTIEGAQFFLFCHDDIELQAGAVQALVEEAFRSNAGIVGAKLVDWDDVDRLRSVGGSIDKFGFSWPVAEPNELDQEQHDAVREAFVVPGAAMLVRCDLFSDLGGFSTDIDGWGEELDLCWRARVAGARTVVMPAAVVRHRERAELGDPSGRSHHLALRHQARIMLACYSPLQVLRIGPQALVLAVLDMIWALVRGRVSVAGDVASAIGWNLLHLPRTIGIRRRVQKSRRTPDSDIRRLQVKGSVRFMSFLRRYTSGNRTVAATLAAAARGLPRSRTDESDGLWPAAAFLVSAVVLFVGSRSLIGSGIPVVREFVPVGSASQLLSEWWSGWRSPGLGASGGTPTLALVAAVGNWLTFGSPGLVRTVLILAPLPLGAWSSWRLLRGCASPQARAAALAAYLVNPVPYNAVSEGRWQALVVYAAVPAVLGRIARAGEWSPFDSAAPAPGSAQRQIVGLGLVLAAATTIAPVMAIVTVGLAALVVVPMTLLAGGGRPLRAIGVVGGALVVSALVHLPWTISVLGSSNRWSILSGGGASARTPLGLDRAVMFDTGAHGGPVSIGLVVAAAVAILIARNDRFRWGVVAGSMVLVSFAAVVIGGRLSADVAMPAAEVVLAVAAAGIVLAVAVGVDAFRADVVGGAFGWRQLSSLIAVVAIVVSAVPLVLDFVDGRWLAPESDLDVALAPIRSESAVANERTLWIADADALATQGWTLADGMRFAVTNGVRPTFSSLFPPAPGPAERELARVLRAAADGGSSRLGASLAQFGIRYVVVEERLAPLPYGRLRLPIDVELADQLHEQFDLARVDVAPGVEVYENLARLPIRSTVGVDGVEALGRPGADPASVGAEPWRSTGRPTRLTGDLPADRSLLVLSARDPRWTLTVDGEAVTPRRFGGWATRYEVGAGGRGVLAASTPASQVVLHLAQLLVVAALPWLRRRRISEFRVRSAEAS